MKAFGRKLHYNGDLTSENSNPLSEYICQLVVVKQLICSRRRHCVEGPEKLTSSRCTSNHEKLLHLVQNWKFSWCATQVYCIYNADHLSDHCIHIFWILFWVYVIDSPMQKGKWINGMNATFQFWMFYNWANILYMSCMLNPSPQSTKCWEMLFKPLPTQVKSTVVSFIGMQAATRKSALVEHSYRWRVWLRMGMSMKCCTFRISCRLPHQG